MLIGYPPSKLKEELFNVVMFDACCNITAFQQRTYNHNSNQKCNDNKVNICSSRVRIFYLLLCAENLFKFLLILGSTVGPSHRYFPRFSGIVAKGWLCGL